MDADSDEEGFYGPASGGNGLGRTDATSEVKMEDVDDGEEEGEEVESDDSSDSSINFETDAKAPKVETSTQSKRLPVVAPTQQNPRKASVTPTPAVKTEVKTEKPSSQSPNSRPGTEYSARHTSKLDPNGNPVHPATGKPIQSTDFDIDFPSESTKPWRKPGSDITDYFNYGFDEFTWASYCLKQKEMPKEIKEINAQAEQMKAFVEGIPGGAMPGMAAIPTGPAASSTMPGMPGMPGEAEMQQMFQTMMAQGMDPSSMDSSQFMQMMMGGQGFPGQNLGFGAGGGQAPQGPQVGFNSGGGSFEQAGNFAGSGRGRGRGGRRNWG